MQLTSEFAVFIGRFHPLLVHLPIGFICIGIPLQWMRWERPSPVLNRVLKFLWLMAGVAGVLSVATGLLLASGDGYEENTLGLHKAGGIVVAVFCWLFYLSYRLPLTAGNKRAGGVQLGLTVILSVALVLTGHWGGSLTHGATYLTEFAPFSKNTNVIAGGQQREIKELDSAYLFEDAVLPILQAKCVSCHSEEKKKGEYLLNTYAAILAGGKSGPGVVAGNLAGSELFRRISLPKEHKEFMPADGKTPLSEEQVAILEWWIETGAQQQQQVATLRPAAPIKDRLVHFFQLDRDAVASYQAAPASEKAIQLVLENGFQVNRLTKTTNLLEVKFNGNGTVKPDLSVLSGIGEQLVWLQLENCQLTDTDLSALHPLNNLYKLNLNRNPLTEKGLEFLTVNTKLEYLNLYGTKVTNSGVPVLAQLPALKKLYLWDSEVNPALLNQSDAQRKGVEIVLEVER